MNIKQFSSKLMPLLCSTENEEAFHALRMVTGGLSAPKVAKIINYASKCCEENEIYCEFGTFTGYTLCSAVYQTRTKCVGIDDLSMTDFYSPEKLEEAKTEIRNKIIKNIDWIRNKEHVLFFEKDFRTITLEMEKKIGVLYIDGKHTYEQTMQAFEWADPMLADNAVVIVDDLNIHGVQQSVMSQLENGKYWLLLWALGTPEFDDGFHTLDQYIQTGLGVLVRKKKNAE